MKRHFFLHLLFASVIATSSPSSTIAGEWELFPHANVWEGECTAQFTGVISSGDLTEAFLDGRIESGHRICLNSPGGNVLEVYNFIKLFDEASRQNDKQIFEGCCCFCRR